MATSSERLPTVSKPRRRANALTLLARPRALWRFLWDPAAPRLPRVLAMLAVFYIVLPVDLVPDLVPVFGWLDDLGVTAAVITYVAAQAAKHTRLKDG
jgi:uncharacterized membrane protein YkvA (DUF1232 family)